MLSKICRREFRYCRRETENDGFTTAVFCRGEKIAVRPYFPQVVAGCSYSVPKWRLLSHY
jgi:hypothetical protein